MSIGLNAEEKLYQVSLLEFAEGRKSPMFISPPNLLYFPAFAPT